MKLDSAITDTIKFALSWLSVILSVLIFAISVSNCKPEPVAINKANPKKKTETEFYLFHYKTIETDE